MTVLRILIATAVTLAATWVLFLLALAVFRPKAMGLKETRQLVPDTIRLVRDLAGDPSLPKSIRRRLGVLVIYLALPIDIVPDFIPVIGYADDIIILALVLRSVIKQAGPDALERHWTGSQDGLALRRLTRTGM